MITSWHQLPDILASLTLPASLPQNSTSNLLSHKCIFYEVLCIDPCVDTMHSYVISVWYGYIENVFCCSRLSPLQVDQQRETDDRHSPTWTHALCKLVAVGVCVRLWDILTGNSEYISLDLSGDLDATSPLSVVCPTQARHIGHTALMDVHHTVWNTYAHTHTHQNMTIFEQ